MTVTVSYDQAVKVGEELNIDFNTVPKDVWLYAMNVELEHGTKFGITNVSNDDLTITGKIALAHILEFPDYYQRLKVMEAEAEVAWENKDKDKHKNNIIFNVVIGLLFAIHTLLR